MLALRYSFVEYLRANMSKDNFNLLFKTLVIVISSIIAIGLAVLTLSGKVAPWTGRFYSLLDPSYAKNNIPIIASVSEHQPTSWSSFYFDLQILTFLFPAGLYYCFTKMTDHNIFIILYGIFAVYFAGVMVRLMLVLAPVMCIMGGIAVSSSLSTYMKYLDKEKTPQINGKPQGSAGKQNRAKPGDSSEAQKEGVAWFFVVMMTFFLITYTFHCTWVTSEAYSSPSIVLSARSHDGSRIIFDDFREAYWWLRMNTAEDAKA